MWHMQGNTLVPNVAVIIVFILTMHVNPTILKMSSKTMIPNNLIKDGEVSTYENVGLIQPT